MNIAVMTVTANLSIAIIGISVGWGLTRLMDMAAGVNFRKDALPRIMQGTLSVAAYYGLRLMAVYGFIGYCVSRVPY